MYIVQMISSKSIIDHYIICNCQQTWSKIDTSVSTNYVSTCSGLFAKTYLIYSVQLLTQM